MNKLWKSKTKMVELCKKFGGTLNPDRVTDPQGNRVYTMQYKGDVVGFKSMHDVYMWLILKTSSARRTNKTKISK